MKRTYEFQLPYLEWGDMLYSSDEEERWEGTDSTLHVAAASCGVGIVSGCTVTYYARLVTIASGVVMVDGRHINFDGWSGYAQVTGNPIYVYITCTVADNGTVTLTPGCTADTLAAGQIELARVQYI